jgi:hypothetical protein
MVKVLRYIKNGGEVGGYVMARTARTLAERGYVELEKLNGGGWLRGHLTPLGEKALQWRSR